MTFDQEEETKRGEQVDAVMQAFILQKEAKVKQEENLEKILKQQNKHSNKEVSKRCKPEVFFQKR